MVVDPRSRIVEPPRRGVGGEIGGDFGGSMFLLLILFGGGHFGEGVRFVLLGGGGKLCFCWGRGGVMLEGSKFCFCSGGGSFGGGV